MRSAASASSASVPAKHEPGSISANSVRDETSRRAQRAAQQADRLAHEPVALRARRSVASTASTAAASPSVFRSQVPMSSSLVRSYRIASSSSRAIASGHQAAPAASMPAMSVGCGAARRLHRERRGARGAVDRDVDVRVVDRRRRRPSRCERRQRDALARRPARSLCARARARAPARAARTAPAWRPRRPAASPSRAGRARLRRWCRRCRRGRGARGACRSRASGRRCRAARRAAAPRAARPTTSGRRPG